MEIQHAHQKEKTMKYMLCGRVLKMVLENVQLLSLTKYIMIVVVLSWFLYCDKAVQPSNHSEQQQKIKQEQALDPNQQLRNCIGIDTYNAVCIKAALEKGADVETQDDEGSTALKRAIYRRDIEMINLLLEYNVDINRSNRDGDSMLMLAARGGNLDIVQLLIDNGVDINYTCGSENAMTSAARHNRYEVAHLLVQNGFNVKEYGASALGWAVGNNNVKFVKLLLDNEADVNHYEETMPEKTPLDVAIEMKNGYGLDNSEMMRILKEAGAKTGREIEEEQGITPAE